MCSVVLALNAVGDGNIFRHEDVGFDGGGRGIRGKGARGVSCGWDGQLLQPEMTSHGHRGRESARFERAGRIQAFVFDKDVGIFPAAQHGSKSLAQRNRRCFRQDGVVAPHGRSQRQQRGRRKTSLNAGQIVAGVQDAAIFRANRLRPVGGIMLATARAFQVSEARHAESLSGVRASPQHRSIGCSTCEAYVAVVRRNAG